MFAATVLNRTLALLNGRRGPASALQGQSRSGRRYSTRLEDEGAARLEPRLADHGYRIEPGRPPPDGKLARGLGAGQAPIDARIHSLVDAMAGFAPPAPGQTTLHAASYPPTLAPMITADGGSLV